MLHLSLDALTLLHIKLSNIWIAWAKSTTEESLNSIAKPNHLAVLDTILVDGALNT